MPPRKLLAVDFLNLAFRAYHAPGYKGLTAPDGRPSGAVFGLMAMTQSLISVSGATHVAFAFESIEPTFRHEADAGYKAGRAEQPEGFEEQITLANKAVGAMGWARYRSPRHEADDVLAVLGKEAIEHGFDHVYIATSDKDLFGAVAQNVSMIWTAQGMSKITENIYNPTKVHERYGVSPTNFPDWKALAGDASDRIDGCPGIGPVTATDLLGRFETLDGMWAHLDEVKPSVRSKLEAGAEAVRKSRHMVGLVFDAPLTPLFDPEAGELGRDDRARTLAFLESWGLTSVVRRLPPVKTPL